MEDKSKNEKEIERYEKIVDRAHKEIVGVRHVYIWLVSVLGIIFVVGMGIAAYITYDTIGGIKSNVEGKVGRLEKRVEERIEEQFDQKNIRKLVEDKATERIDKIADKLIGEKIDEKVNPLIRSVETQVRDVNSRLVAIEERQNQMIAASEKKLRVLEEDTEKSLKATQIRSEFLLTVLRAQNGDKESWLKLIQIAEKDQETELGVFAVDAAKRIHTDFFKKEGQRSEYYSPIVSDSEVVENLSHKWLKKRKMAVYTIKERAMYDKIPDLISMIHRENNLDVLGEIYRVLNDLLGTDIKFSEDPDKDALRFEKAWKAKKKQLEETKGDKQP